MSDDLYDVGRALVSLNTDGTSFINIMNPSNTDIQLKDKAKIAWATPIVYPEVQILAVHHQTANGPVTPSNGMPASEISPEADWESKLPHFPIATPPNYDVCTEIDLSGFALSDEHKEQLRIILRHHAFVGRDGHLGRYNGNIRHRIDLIDNAPIPSRKIYRVPLEKRKEIEKQITQMLSDGIIRKSSSAYCAPIVLVKKREANAWRFTIDFRGLNAITNPQQSIFPNNQDIIDLCANQCLYNSLDFQQGFRQIPLEESHCERTAFACFLGAFEYIRMPMGLKGASATFQRIMEDFKKHLRERVFIYIDHLIITSETADEHLHDIDEVLGKKQDIGMKLKGPKCEFARKEIKFLGFILSKDGIRPNPEKTRAIDAFPTPRTTTDIKAFIGMYSFFRRFIHNFASIAAPLTALTKKDTPFEWTKECENAMNNLKKALTSAPILGAPRLGRPFIIETDSSGKGTAAVLKQDQDGHEKVIAYASRTLSKHESRYPAIELEALGLVFAVEKFRPYIDGAKTTIITDHAQLKALLHRKDLTGRLAKYQIVLQEFDIDIVYRPGRKNIVCDTLSRYLTTVNATFANIDNLQMGKLRDEHEKCTWIFELKDSLRKQLDNDHTIDYILVDNILYKIPTRLHQDPQIVVPEGSQLKEMLITMTHESPTGTSHQGASKTHALIKKFAIWNNMKRDIHRFITRCEQCQKRKDPSAYRSTEPLMPLETPTRPWQRVHSDIIGPLPLTLQGNKFIVVFVDAFSKFIIAEPLSDQKALTTAETFTKRFMSRFGLPERLVTDQGTNYTSEIFRNLLQQFGITHRMSTPYHHQTNGQVGRANRTLQQLVSIATVQHQDNWDEYFT
ncbi:unnamed protein product [Heligmosomoides polygyrus]|uniref:RNA-directed DNA polymerase n=1 Tax=Heligmosomoides polygyrus TaxID=6339 RepID=A0A183GR95_HELPZ|nr:unnamed protein product [Heligmosomoides polygyrus]